MSKQSLDATTQLFHNSILAGCHSLEIKTIRKVGDTESLSLLQTIQDLGILTESLCRDATLVQTSSAHMAGLDQNNLDSPFRSKQGGLITARPCTYNYYLHNILFWKIFIINSLTRHTNAA